MEDPYRKHGEHANLRQDGEECLHAECENGFKIELKRKTDVFQLK